MLLSSLAKFLELLNMWNSNEFMLNKLKNVVIFPVFKQGNQNQCWGKWEFVSDYSVNNTVGEERINEVFQLPSIWTPVLENGSFDLMMMH
jgi:hypothetical protein